MHLLTNSREIHKKAEPSWLNLHQNLYHQGSHFWKKINKKNFQGKRPAPLVGVRDQMNGAIFDCRSFSRKITPSKFEDKRTTTFLMRFCSRPSSAENKIGESSSNSGLVCCTNILKKTLNRIFFSPLAMG